MPNVTFSWSVLCLPTYKLNIYTIYFKYIYLYTIYTVSKEHLPKIAFVAEESSSLPKHKLVHPQAEESFQNICHSTNIAKGAYWCLWDWLRMPNRGGSAGIQNWAFQKLNLFWWVLDMVKNVSVPWLKTLTIISVLIQWPDLKSIWGKLNSFWNAQ